MNEDFEKWWKSLDADFWRHASSDYDVAKTAFEEGYFAGRYARDEELNGY